VREPIAPLDFSLERQIVNISFHEVVSESSLGVSFREYIQSKCVHLEEESCEVNQSTESRVQMTNRHQRKLI
jgi:hypothetical protein